MAANLPGPDEVEAILGQVETVVEMIVVEMVVDEVEMVDDQVETIVVEEVDDQVEMTVEEVENVEMVDEQIPKHFASLPA
jgi:hypothetical protein